MSFAIIRIYTATFYKNRKVIATLTVKATTLTKAAALAEDEYVGTTGNSEYSYNKVVFTTE